MTVRPINPAYSGISHIIATKFVDGQLTLELRGADASDFLTLSLHFRADSRVDVAALADAINSAQSAPVVLKFAPGTERAQLEAFLAGRAKA